jgi:hypothetical protein
LLQIRLSFRDFILLDLTSCARIEKDDDELLDVGAEPVQFGFVVDPLELDPEED